MNDIVKAKKSKFILKILIIVSIIIVSIVVLCTIFGIVDCFRAKSGKKPIFIYHTVNDSYFDVEIVGFEDAALPSKEGATYYGIGYAVSICDISTGKYTFQLGDKKTESCYTSLACTADEKGTLVLNDDSTVLYDENDKDNYYYTFFEDKLIQVTATLIRPISSVENVETSSAEIKEFYDNIPGCAGMRKKINEEAYETVITCAIPKMSSNDIERYLPIRTKELLGYTRDEVIAYHHNDLKCE
jgi:hypothetical protein